MFSHEPPYYLKEERRDCKRAKVGALFVYRIEKPLFLRKIVGCDEEINAVMIDLSENGMGFITEYAIPEGAILFFRFILLYSIMNEKEQVKAIEAVGRVQYELFVEESEYRVGIRFNYITDEDRESIAGFVKKYYSTNK
ncbi:MAG: PilZ domain-containing protein [Candidatus Omnitrophota bacterium]